MNATLPARAFHVLIFALTFALVGCSSTLVQRAQRADGLFGFMADYPGADVIPVERISRGSGEIVTAHAHVHRGELLVSGLVGRSSLHDPPYGSHIDVLVIDAGGKTVAAQAADYLPRHFPRRIRGNRGYSHYVTRFSTIPPAGSTVKVIFHGAPRTLCALHPSP